MTEKNIKQEKNKEKKTRKVRPERKDVWCEPKIKRLNETSELNNYDLADERLIVKELKKVLMEINITPMYKGFNYIIDGVRILYRNRFTHILITKDIYIPLAMLYYTTPELVEHGMRTAIQKGWHKTTSMKLKEEVYRRCDKSPSNYAFLVNILNYVEERIAP